MTDKEIAELRRRLRPEKQNINRIVGCYVNEKKDIVSVFELSPALMPLEEAEQYLALFRRTLSGTQGKNLIDITFATAQVMDSEEHRMLTALRDTKLKDEATLQGFLQRVVDSLTMEGQYLILLAYDAYDVPLRSRDGIEMEDTSENMFQYVLCSICPVKLSKAALRYSHQENEFHNRAQDWVVAAPELGFMFPAFDGRGTNLYNALYYTRDTGEVHHELIDTLFNTPVPMPAKVQKQTFQSALSEALAEECSYEVVQTLHEQLCEKIEEHKTGNSEEPLTVSKREFSSALRACGVSGAHVDAFAQKLDEEFEDSDSLLPRNIIDTKKIELRTPQVVITVPPEASDLIETRIINGGKYIVINADEGVEVNGVNISFPQE